MAEELRRILAERRLHPLVAFTHYFDVDRDYKVGPEEFAAGLQRIGWKGDAQELFHRVDANGSENITLAEIDHLSADLWASFKAWCAQVFGSAEDMEAKFSCIFKQDGDGGLQGMGAGGKQMTVQPSIGKGHRGGVLSVSKGFVKEQFVEHALRNGWYGGHESLLFAVMDCGRRKYVCAEDLSWFEREREKELKRREMASKLLKHKNGVKCNLSPMRAKMQSLRSLQAFAAFLKRQYGGLFRAWRCVLDRDGAMEVSRKKFFAACRELNWSGDIAGLWHALDADDGGTSSLEELAPRDARTLGIFKQWANSTFGDMQTTMKALGSASGNARARVFSFTKKQWVTACQIKGFLGDAAAVFDLMDWERDGRVTMREVQCLDRWNVPAEWLLATPNPAAAQAFRDLLYKKYKHFLKAWCVALDTVGVGKVFWVDFQRATSKLHFKGDIPGAWAALDDDGSGFITLREIDSFSALILADFRTWASNEFGSIAHALEVFDKDGSGSLSLREFTRGCSKHGYKGDAFKLFRSLDFDGDSKIGQAELHFIDEWNLMELLDDGTVNVDAFVDEDEEADAGGEAVGAEQSLQSPSGREASQAFERVWPRTGVLSTLRVPWSGGKLRLLVAGGPPSARGRCRQRPFLHEEVLADIAGRRPPPARGYARLQGAAALPPVELLHRVGWASAQ